MSRVVVTGAQGRMGGQILRAVRAEPGLQIVGATERPGFPAGLDAGVAAGLGAIGVAVTSDLADVLSRGADVVVDFTSHEASAAHAALCAKAGVALVIGSTGFTPETRARVAEAARRIAIVQSPNMSVGVNVVFALVREAARALGDAYDVEIVEMHHNKKKDAPSGTAMRLGMVGERPRREIGVQALRGGDVVGDHTVFFVGEGERVEVIHRATSREQFARGAVRAARWVVGKPAGLYDMADVLGLKRAG